MALGLPDGLSHLRNALTEALSIGSGIRTDLQILLDIRSELRLQNDLKVLELSNIPTLATSAERIRTKHRPDPATSDISLRLNGKA